MSRAPALEFECVRVEGALIAPDFLLQVAELSAPEQDAASYGVPRGLTVRDEIGRAWRIAEACWREMDAMGSAHSVRRDRAIVAMLRDAFGWITITPLTEAVELSDRAFPLGATALDGQLPLVLAAGSEGLDDATRRHGDGNRRRSPFGLLQEYLNANEQALWGVVTNGAQLRIVRDNASLTRPAYIEADMARIIGEQRYADFSLLWLLLHQSRFGRTNDAGQALSSYDAPLELWRSKALAVGTVARDRLRVGVEQALRALGNGFLAHPRNLDLRARLTGGSLEVTAYHQQLLRLVYRCIFLMVAEERELLHPEEADAEAIAMYRGGYGMQRLRERAAHRRAYDRHDDAWEALRVVWRGCATGEPELALPGLGGLFAHDQCADLDSARLGNRYLLDAVFHLTWLKQDHAIARVNWRDMGTEELGSVYESLLELVPEVREDGRGFGFVGDGAFGAGGQGAGTAGNARKLSGSYYTPDSLVQALLESALDPVIDRAVQQLDAEKALLELAVLDPAMGSGHFLLGAGRRLAGRLAKLRVDGTPGPAAYRQALREVVAHCLYGVDKNPMAVELARIALWLEAMEPGKPLAFLDHHLVNGDAILGVQDPAVLAEGIPAEAFAALTGDDPEVVKTLRRTNASALKALAMERKGGQFVLPFDMGGLAARLAQVDALPDHTLRDVEVKRSALQEAQRSADARFRLACDAFVAAFVMRKDRDSEALVPTTATLRDVTLGIMPSTAMQDAIGEVAERAPFLHWPIDFAQVMARGGFDCVLGNPPWEKIKLSEKEFFASRDPEIANAANASARERKIAALGRAPVGSAERRLFDAFERARQELEGASRYARTSGRFPLTGTGDVNLYALFAEGALRLVRNGGRAGLVLPSGIASDAGTAPFFRHLADGRLVSMLDFENRDALFAGVHRSYKFCLLTIGEATEARFACFLTQPEQRHDARRRFSLTPDDLRRLNPNTGNAPVFRSQADAELTAKIYRNVPVLWDETREDGNPWGLSFGTLFHMSNDSGLFHTKPGPGLVPLYEAKMIHQFDHRYGSFEQRDEGRGYRVLPETPQELYADPSYEVQPFYWVKAEEVSERLPQDYRSDWLLAFKDVTSPTNERTVVSSIIPKVGVGHTAPLMFVNNPTFGRATDSAIMVAILNSLVLDYVARNKVNGLHLTYFYLRQFPIPSAASIKKASVLAIVERVLALCCTSQSLEGFANELRSELKADWQTSRTTFQQREWDTTTRSVYRAELDAIVAHLYGLTRDDLQFILDPAEIYGPSFPSETFRVLKAGELRAFGEFRTQRLVLEAWDRLIGAR